MSDLDIVNHVNNVKYLEWCLDLIETKEIFNQKIKSIDMNFMKEIVLKDIVAIKKLERDNRTIFSIEKENNACFAMELNWK